ncbi:glycyl-radical enzyme activating protein, partial [Thermodesulfobacteriota bacterium]
YRRIYTKIEQRKKMNIERLNNKGTVFNIQCFSLQDGPGIRTTVFIKGCPLRCWWCSNPESQAFNPEVVHSNSLCTQCGECVKACPTQAISLAERGVRIDRKLCENCATCVSVCYAGALKVYGEEMSTAEVIAEVEKDVAYYRNSEGGVTFSGGEPLSQPEFVISLLKQCRKSGLHTVVDTCGYVAQEVFKRMLRNTDLVLYDLKHANELTHKRLTAVSNRPILNNLKMVAQSGVDVIVRVPIITDINDSLKNMTAIAKYVASLKTIKEVNLLPYHRFGTGKYEMLDSTYRLNSTLPPKEARLEKLTKIVESYGLECKIEG